MIVRDVKFTIETDYLVTEYDVLKKLGVYYWKKQGDKSVCVWTFTLDKIKEVEAILAKPIEFTQEILKTIQERTPLPREQIDLPEFKGKSGYIIKEDNLPECYEVIEWRKIETDEGKIEIQQITHELPSENVNVMRLVLEDIEEWRYKDSKIPCDVLANKVITAFGITRFHKPNSIFSWAKFFGSRKAYFSYYYYPLKVLVWKNEVFHHKNGKISKIKYPSQKSLSVFEEVKT